MEFNFYVNPQQGYLLGKVIIHLSDKLGQQFYLNWEFEVEQILCDGIEKEYEVRSVLLEELDGYKVNCYSLPIFENTIEITYKGALSGKSGCCSYARETINSDFTLLRVETFCYPIFIEAKEDSLRSYFQRFEEFVVKIEIPKDYIAVSSGKTLSLEQAVHNCWEEKMNSYNFAIAIARYVEKRLSLGKFYFLQENEKIRLIEKTLGDTHQFMNTRFGKREIQSAIKYVTIPKHMGSFVLGEAVFIEESHYSQVKELEPLIHEFIHLGWNARTDIETQKIRFFDEAFTSYFQLRVMEELLTQDEYKKVVKEYQESYKRCKQYLIKDVPIIHYGEYGYSDLSYTVGAFCLEQLCHQLGRERFDEVTTIFLEKYQQIPVDMETFCKEYITLSQKSELKEFFNDWIYTTKGLHQLKFDEDKI